ncbi:SH3 domain-containing protein [Streptomyces monashensis]|jgi:uncharacterized protein YraI|uniref:SH3 domain-containing protein n=1 Tax=Streptomyces monashensis TaxID=1678012 RepID=UPI0033C5242E
MVSRHSIARSAATVLLAGGIAAGSLAGAAEAQAAPVHHGYRHHSVEGRVVSRTPLTVRYGPGTNRWATGTVSPGMHVWIKCKAEGSDVGGNNRWYKLADGQGWASAHYVRNYHHVRWCDS